MFAIIWEKIIKIFDIIIYKNNKIIKLVIFSLIQIDLIYMDIFYLT